MKGGGGQISITFFFDGPFGLLPLLFWMDQTKAIRAEDFVQCNPEEVDSLAVRVKKLSVLRCGNWISIEEILRREGNLN